MDHVVIFDNVERFGLVVGIVCEDTDLHLHHRVSPPLPRWRRRGGWRNSTGE